MITFTKNEQHLYQIQTPIEKLKIGVIARMANEIDYGRELHQIRKDEKQLLKSFTGLPEKNIVFLNQVHEDTILFIDAPPDKDEIYFGDADGLITTIPGICLVIRTADCVPIFVYDTKNEVLGAAHSGWKGTRLLIAQKLVHKMKTLFGSDNENIEVFILPSIGPNSYEVNYDVAQYFKEESIPREDKYLLNLWQNIEKSLLKEGIPKENIFNSQICNLEQCHEFFSHRNGDLGRNLNFAFINNE